MFERWRPRFWSAWRRVRRIERRELQEFRNWVEHTGNLLHLSVITFVPLLIAFVTYVSQVSEDVSFLLFPPLASGTYTLFANPESKYASPVRFVGGLTAGALCGLLAVRAADVLPWATGSPATTAASAAVAIFAVGTVTWAADVEAPSAFSAALLTLVADYGEVVPYVLGIVVASSFVAGVFYAWRELIYDRRAQYLYQTTKSDDRVLVPVVGDQGREAALFAAHLAGAHEAGKVVLLDVVADDAVAAAEDAIATERATGDDAPVDGDDAVEDATTDAREQVAGQAAMRLERLASRVRTRVGVPCEVVVASAASGRTNVTLRAAEEANCDLIVAPYEESHGSLSGYLKGLFEAPVDVVVFRGGDDEFDQTWRNVLVSVGRPGDTAHAMLDFATRVAGRAGTLAVCHCIGAESQRRRAEAMLANLVETFDAGFETRVSRASIERFLAANATQYDLVVVGASTDRSAASRFLAPPTFERITDVKTDVAIVHRGKH
ncbi:HPP family protein [Halorubellus sp. PRR65]|uniref:HPP family protein n=1 Tax=Halorubellus sp. PRR65 TaxID=3098148 RepID=UPI002B25FE82|nr:HPP family protein [Halorubellus sp. PRR65]